LSEELVLLVTDLLPGSLHVPSLGGQRAADSTIWQMARELGCALVTKNEDFHRFSVLRSAPPKVVWLCHGGAGVVY
jgi:predicted nuclease of predicted toxin-antitoxin system